MDNWMWKTALAFALLAVPPGVYLKSRNDARHVEKMERQVVAQERTAAALEMIEGKLAVEVHVTDAKKVVRASYGGARPSSIECGFVNGSESCVPQRSLLR